MASEHPSSAGSSHFTSRMSPNALPPSPNQQDTLSFWCL
eukprot:CAMPEP_0202912990 /NCGR_PEP_ID=MMETSP1392-20130828/59232_1 /ASSEMBLY_ACC=CAM_ASM_000868 /TAXON_ID=225041 /ORGANISM="Chlamydomonas chlamydogama, Strain SAG 11-48b" /LENGTH=38 /DNA_ID= /DNA_START= /DNA_END= /DNA_ORIENTATION=